MVNLVEEDILAKASNLKLFWLNNVLTPEKTQVRKIDAPAIPLVLRLKEKGRAHSDCSLPEIGDDRVQQIRDFCAGQTTEKATEGTACFLTNFPYGSFFVMSI
jgi:hypothetical protein